MERRVKHGKNPFFLTVFRIYTPPQLEVFKSDEVECGSQKYLILYLEAVTIFFIYTATDNIAVPL